MDLGAEVQNFAEYAPLIGVSPPHITIGFKKKTSSNQWLCGGDSTQQNFVQGGSTPRSNPLPLYTIFQ